MQRGSEGPAATMAAPLGVRQSPADFRLVIFEISGCAGGNSARRTVLQSIRQWIEYAPALSWPVVSALRLESWPFISPPPVILFWVWTIQPMLRTMLMCRQDWLGLR